MIKFIILAFATMFASHVFSQNDKIIFKEYQPGFYENNILKDNTQKNYTENKVRKYPSLLSTNDFPTDTALYKKVWHNNPLSQGITGTCWAFGATSFLESEIYRNSKQKVKLSEMYIVYFEYVDRAINFVKTRGETYLGEGSESNAIKRVIKNYGIVLNDDFSGNPINIPFYDHRKLFEEYENYLISVKKSNFWNEKLVVENIKAILEKYLGTPPEIIKYQNKSYSPKEFAQNVLKINLSDIFSFMSTMECNFNEKHELVEPDNWWHDDNYYNLSIDNYLNLVKESIDNGFSNCICGDVSEIGNIREQGVSIIPTFDIATENINNEARYIRLQNGSTTDDHCMHLVGYYKLNNDFWFLLKDSGAGGFDSKVPGYRFVHEDYIKLKMMNVLISGRGAKKYLDKIIK